MASLRPKTAPTSLPALGLADSPAEAPRPFTPAQLASFREADTVFKAVDRTNSGKITAGMMLCSMIERGIDDNVLPLTFLRMNIDGSGAISLDEWRQGYKRYIKNAGLRLKKDVLNEAWAEPPKQYSPEEMKDFDQRAEDLLAPKVKQLQYTFSIFDRDGSGMLRVPHITAYGRVLGGKKDETPYGIGIVPPDPALLVKALDKTGKGGIDFNEFRAILARHEAAFGDDGTGKGKKGGKKGKGGGKGKGKKKK